MDFSRWYDLRDRHGKTVHSLRVTVDPAIPSGPAATSESWSSRVRITGLEPGEKADEAHCEWAHAPDSIGAWIAGLQRVHLLLRDWQKPYGEDSALAWRELARIIHEDSHQNAGSAAFGSLQAIGARSRALRSSTGLGNWGALDLLDGVATGQAKGALDPSRTKTRPRPNFLEREFRLTAASGERQAVTLLVDPPTPYDADVESPCSARFVVHGLSREKELNGSGHGLDAISALQNALENGGFVIRNSPEARKGRLVWEAEPDDPQLGLPRPLGRLRQGAGTEE